MSGSAKMQKLKDVLYWFMLLGYNKKYWFWSTFRLRRSGKNSVMSPCILYIQLPLMTTFYINYNSLSSQETDIGINSIADFI